MELIGVHIEQMQLLINTPLIPPPVWAKTWQTEAEHILFLAHSAKDNEDLKQLMMLDEEADRMVKFRIDRLANRLDKTKGPG